MELTGVLEIALNSVAILVEKRALRAVEWQGKFVAHALVTPGPSRGYLTKELDSAQSFGTQIKT